MKEEARRPVSPRWVNGGIFLRLEKAPLGEKEARGLDVVVLTKNIQAVGRQCVCLWSVDARERGIGFLF